MEIREEVGEENIFIFGLREEQIREWRESGYDPRQLLSANQELREAIDLVIENAFCASEPGLFDPLMRSLTDHGDPYMLLADFDSYSSAQERVSRIWRDQDHWTRMSIANVAAMGRFSSDRTIREYASEIWGVKPVSVGRTTPAGKKASSSLGPKTPGPKTRARKASSSKTLGPKTQGRKTRGPRTQGK